MHGHEKALRPHLGREDRGCTGDAGADAGLEVAADADRNGVRATIGLKTLEVEGKLLDALPEVRVIDVAAVGVERLDHLEEGALQGRRLGRRVQGRRARVLAGDRKVAKDDLCLAAGDLRPSRGAMRTAQVGVDDQLWALAVAMILRACRGNRGAGQLRRQG
jgi:hypothetical protein